MPKVVDKQRKADEIAAAAMKVFADSGFQPARMADIAVAAGVGKGTLYEYFEDKRDILRYAFNGYFTAFREGALVAIASAPEPDRQLLALVSFAIDHLDDWEEHCTVYVDYHATARTAPAGEFSIAGMYEEFRSILRVLMEQGQQAGAVDPDLDPAATAELLVSIYDGVILHGVLEGRPRDTEGLRATMVRILTGGLLTPRGRTRNGRRSCSATSS